MIFNASTVLTIILSLMLYGAAGQEYLPFAPGAHSRKTVHEPWLAPVAGVTPSQDALRLGVMSGNLVLRRVGGYMVAEKKTGPGYFTNIMGATFTITKNSYIWGGIDLFSSRGLLASGNLARKEVGLGIVPWKELVLLSGWSEGVGFTFSAGWRIYI